MFADYCTNSTLPYPCLETLPDIFKFQKNIFDQCKRRKLSLPGNVTTNWLIKSLPTMYNGDPNTRLARYSNCKSVSSFQMFGFKPWSKYWTILSGIQQCFMLLLLQYAILEKLLTLILDRNLKGSTNHVTVTIPITNTKKSGFALSRKCLKIKVV